VAAHADAESGAAGLELGVLNSGGRKAWNAAQIQAWSNTPRRSEAGLTSGRICYRRVSRSC